MLSERGTHVASARWVPLTLTAKHALEYPFLRDVMLTPEFLDSSIFARGPVRARFPRRELGVDAVVSCTAAGTTMGARVPAPMPAPIICDKWLRPMGNAAS